MTSVFRNRATNQNLPAYKKGMLRITQHTFLLLFLRPAGTRNDKQLQLCGGYLFRLFLHPHGIIIAGIADQRPILDRLSW